MHMLGICILKYTFFIKEFQSQVYLYLDNYELRSVILQIYFFKLIKKTIQQIVSITCKIREVLRLKSLLCLKTDVPFKPSGNINKNFSRVIILSMYCNNKY